jgi:hypothetical protein
MFWNAPSICLPTTLRATAATMATKRKKTAYSISPWPLRRSNGTGVADPPLPLSVSVFRDGHTSEVAPAGPERFRRRE